MLSAECETIGMDFRLVVFTRTYAELAHQVQPDTIVVIQGKAVIE
jgi:hypothetical protein